MGVSAGSTPLQCERVRAQVSLRLDGELSQLEQRMVAAHLGRCADCRAFEESIVSFTTALRSAPLEQLSRPVVVRRTRRVSLVGAHAGVAATLVIALVGLVTQLDARSPRATAEPKVSAQKLFEATWRPEWELAQITPDTEAAPPRPGIWPGVGGLAARSSLARRRQQGTQENVRRASPMRRAPATHEARASGFVSFLQPARSNRPFVTTASVRPYQA